MPPREGAFAERLAMPQGNLVEVPAHVPTEVAALTEPLACGWHAARLAEERLAGPLEEARCLVLGGGAIGLGAALALWAQGAREIHIAEPSAARRAVIAAFTPLRPLPPISACSITSRNSSTEPLAIASSMSSARQKGWRR